MSMNPIYIDGIGILSRCANSIDELKDLLNKEEAYEIHNTGKWDYTPIVPSAKLRRCSGYTKLTAETAARAAEDGNITSKRDMLRIGTIISTGFGAAQNNTKFADSVVKGEPALCSPAVFAGSVPNSCIGQICIIGGYKGVSTLLMGGDPLEYTAMLLNSGKADTILCGSVEEYFHELADSIMLREAAQGCEISEGAAILTVSAEKSNRAYCKAVAFGSSSFEECPYLHKTSAEEAEEVIRSAVKQLDNASPDIVFTCANGTYFDNIEQEILRRHFPNSRSYSPKKLFGETLGGGYMMSISLAAVVLREQKLPFSSETFRSPIKNIVVTGVDIAGNYLCTLMEAVSWDS